MKLSELNIEKTLKDREFNWLGLTAEEYTGKEVLTFLTDEKYISEIIANRSISCIITTKEIAEKIKDLNYGILISENPRKTFFELHNKLVDEDFYFKKEKNNISSKAIISPKASIREYNINIEDDVIIEENVVIYPNVTIKKGSIIRANSTIGGNAFEFSRFGDEVLSIKSAGKVLIEENVEIQNNNTVDKGVFGATILHKNVKTDNLVHIGHDVIVGENTFLTACTEISGRVKIGKNAYFGPNCTIRNGIKIGENSKITMGAVVTKDVKDDEVVTGNFAIPHKKYLKVLKFLLNEVEKNEL